MGEWDSSHIILCYDYLRQTNNENIQYATNWLGSLYESPEAYMLLLELFPSLSSEYRRHVIIGISQCVRLTWPLLEHETKEEIMNSFLGLLLIENAWIARSDIIYMIQLAMERTLLYQLLDFIYRIADFENETRIEIALLCATVVKSSELEVLVAKKFNEYTTRLLERGFQSEESSLRIVALHYMLLSPSFDSASFVDDLPFFWEKSVELIDTVSSDKDIFRRVIKLFNFGLQERRFEFDPIPLIEKSLTLINSGQIDTETMIYVGNLFQTICQFYNERILESEIVSDVLLVLLDIQASFFEPDDSISMSAVDFLVSAFIALFNSAEVLSMFWKGLSSLTSSSSGLFAVLCSLCSAFQCNPAFFLDKLDDLTDIILACIESTSILLIETAVHCSCTFLKVFQNENDEITQQIIRASFHAVYKYPSSDNISSFTEIIDLSRQSDDIFLEAFSLMSTIVYENEPVLQAMAINCMSSLAYWSSIQIHVYFNVFVQIMFDILNSTSESSEFLKGYAVDCTVRVASVVGTLFNDFVEEFLDYCMNNLNQEGMVLSLSCFAALETLAENYPSSFNRVIDDIMPLLLDRASKDFSPDYRSILLEYMESSDPENIDLIDAEFAPNFSSSAIALRLFSVIIKNHKYMCYQYSAHLIKCCEIHGFSVSKQCLCASSVAISNLALALDYVDESSFYVASLSVRMAHVLLAIIPEPSSDSDLNANDCETIVEAFHAASTIVDQLDYDSMGICIKPLLDLSKTYISIISKDISISLKFSSVIESISTFISMMISSSATLAPQLLQDFFGLFTELTQNSAPQLRSISLRFASEMISAASSELDQPFINYMLQISLQVASTEDERYSFSCIRVISELFPDLVLPYSEDLYEICIQKLSLPVQKTERFLMMRDNCVSAFGELCMNVFGDEYQISDYIELVLAACPVVIDFDVSENTANFYFWLYNKVGSLYQYHFLRVLVLIFSNPPYTVSSMRYMETTLTQMYLLCSDLIKNVDPDFQMCSDFLNGDQNRLEFLRNSIRGRGVSIL